MVAALAGLMTMALAGGVGAANRDFAQSVNPAIVDVNTNLAYQGSSAAGTGIVLTSSGEVLTNNHVIRGATTIRVTDVGNGRTYSAKVVGYDVSEDIAVLQLKGASNLATVTIGDSSQVKLGDAVAAIGNAGGRGGVPTAAAGTIAGLGQTITANDGDGNSERLIGLIKTDAALEPGDSGGPLVDSAGRVIGIDTAAPSGYQYGSAYSNGGGYAIPINRGMSIARTIMAGRSSATIHIGASPLVGVNVQSIGSGFNNDFSGFNPGSASTSGALVAGVVPSSPADKAGLVAGDVITTADGRTLASPLTLTNLLLHKAPGDTIRLVWYDQFGRTHRATVRLAVGPPQ
jgi:S1-C subfamily serine protease